MTGPFAATVEALRAMRAHHWDLDACYAFDRLIDAAQSLNSGAAYFNADPERMAKLDKHMRRIAQGINATYRAEPLTAREIEIMDAEARSEREKEDV